MQLIAVQFKGFRCLHDTDWIPLSKLSIFIGENDAGKTAALEGVAFLLGVGAPSAQDATSQLPNGEQAPAGDGDSGHGEGHEDLSISGRFRVSATAVADTLLPVDADNVTEITLTWTPECIQWSARGLVPPDHRLRLNPSAATINVLRDALRAVGVEPRGNAKEPLQQALETEIVKAPKVLDAMSMAGPIHRKYFDVVDFRNAQDANSVLDQALRALFRETIRSGKYGTDLAKIETSINKTLQGKADELSTYIKPYRTDVDAVVVEPRVDFSEGFKGAQVTIRDIRGNVVPLALKGEGLHAHLRLAAFEWSKDLLHVESDLTRVFLLDEPENHLDYQSQRRMLRALEQYSSRGQVLVATHSMNLINRVMLDQIVHFELDRATGFSTTRVIRPVAGDENVDINRIGESLGIENATLFYERAFFVFEGETEARALPRMYELATGSKWYVDGVRFVSGQNGEGAIHLARFLHLNGRQVVALVDEDTTWKKGPFDRQFHKSKLEKEAKLPASQIHVIGPKCFELAFSSELWARAVYNATGGKKRLGAKGLEATRTDPRKFLEYLQSHSGGLSKVQLASALARVIRKPEIPPVLVDAFADASARAA